MSQGDQEVLYFMSVNTYWSTKPVLVKQYFVQFILMSAVQYIITLAYVILQALTLNMAPSLVPSLARWTSISEI